MHSNAVDDLTRSIATRSETFSNVPTTSNSQAISPLGVCAVCKSMIQLNISDY